MVSNFVCITKIQNNSEIAIQKAKNLHFFWTFFVASWGTGKSFPLLLIKVILSMVCCFLILCKWLWPFRLLSWSRSIPSASGIFPVRQCSIAETMTRGKRGLLVSVLLHRMGNDGKVGTECFCVWGVSPPSCAQVSGNMPFSLCHGHRVGFRHSDCGAMAETNPVPFLMSCRFFFCHFTPTWWSAWCCRTAVDPLDGHRIEKERRPVGHLSLVLFHQSVVS